MPRLERAGQTHEMMTVIDRVVGIVPIFLRATLPVRKSYSARALVCHGGMRRPRRDLLLRNSLADHPLHGTVAFFEFGNELK